MVVNVYFFFSRTQQWTTRMGTISKRKKKNPCKQHTHTRTYTYTYKRKKTNNFVVGLALFVSTLVAEKGNLRMRTHRTIITKIEKQRKTNKDFMTPPQYAISYTNIIISEDTRTHTITPIWTFCLAVYFNLNSQSMGTARTPEIPKTNAVASCSIHNNKKKLIINRVVGWFLFFFRGVWEREKGKKEENLFLLSILPDPMHHSESKW